VSFLPVFTLESQEGRLFSPLAYTKTFSMAGAALLSVTLVPVLMMLFIRGRILPEAKNPVNRFLIWIYRPIIAWVMRWKKVTIVAALAVLAATLYPATRLGTEFMPTLNEGTLLYMPASLPGMSITKAGELLQTQDKIIKSFPEVESVYGKAGRANSATDPAPVEMFETVINLKPQSEWRPGITTDKLIAELDQALQFPGVSNAWTMPIKARIDMLSTGIRTPIGIKVFGKDLGEMEKLAKQIETVVKKVPGTTSAFAERITGGSYLNIEPDRAQLARYGLSVGELQEVIATALGGEMVTTTVEGRERYGVGVRYPRELRSTPELIEREVLVPTMTGAMVPLGQVAKVEVARGTPGIRTENALLSAYIFVDIRDRDIGSYVADARKAVADQVKFPPGYYATWSGQFEYMERAIERMKIVIPVTLLTIFLLLYLNFRRFTETIIVMLSVPFALVGGVWLMWALGYNLSVAVAVGFIALAGVAAETGVVMLIYLDNAWAEVRDQCAIEGRRPRVQDLYHAIMEGAVERVRPKMMTVVAIMAGLLPIMWGTGTGSEVMSRIAAPMVGGMISSTVLTLAVIPAIYGLVKDGSCGAPRPPRRRNRPPGRRGSRCCDRRGSCAGRVIPPPGSAPAGALQAVRRRHRACTSRPAAKPAATFQTDSAAQAATIQRSRGSRGQRGPRASCAPVMNNITPSTGTEKSWNSQCTAPPKNRPRLSSTPPRITTAPPVRAPKATWAAMPPAPWHIGTPPTQPASRFIRPVLTATSPSCSGRSGKSRLFSSRIATMALPSVSGICGSASSTVPATRSFQPMPPRVKAGQRQPTGAAASCASSSGCSQAPSAPPSASSANIAGTTRLRRNSSASAAASAAAAQPPCIMRAPWSMNPRPSPSTTPTTTARGTSLSTRASQPPAPASSQTQAVTSAAACTAGAPTAPCAAWIAATAPIAFIGCTGTGVR